MQAKFSMPPVLLGLAIMATANVASGQAAPTPTASTEAAPPAEPPPNDMNGVEESPNDPETGEPKASVAAVIRVEDPYPQQDVARPITLARGMAEVKLHTRAILSPFAGNNQLRARYGITHQWQLGLTYNAGGYYDNGKGQAYYTGKAAGLDVTYAWRPWLGASLGLPFYFDPVATSLTLGAPLRLRLNERLTLTALDDLVEIRLHQFTPSYSSEQANRGNANAIATNSITSTGALRFAGRLAFQHNDKMAFWGQFRTIATDFDSLKLSYTLRAGLQYSPRRKLDVGASLGFDDLAVASNSFGLDAWLAIRI